MMKVKKTVKVEGWKPYHHTAMHSREYTRREMMGIFDKTVKMIEVEAYSEFEILLNDIVDGFVKQGKSLDWIQDYVSDGIRYAIQDYKSDNNLID